MDDEAHIEACTVCGNETMHTVSIEIIEEGEDDGNGSSRQPYHIAECVECGTKTQQRVNKA
ncbi:hypothetical protein [Haladaptatus sp. CMAA 1911]|uniref:DUF7835 family putative zinc beta-ribbon protein n=1 Tax=unclassified Haladaptatus TaxID=2622732 RepID=UPI003754B621